MPQTAVAAKKPTLEDLINQQAPAIRDAFLEAVYRQRERVDVTALYRALERRDIDAAIRACNLDEASFRGLERAIETAFEGGGEWQIDQIPVRKSPDGPRLDIHFNFRNTPAETWLRNHSATLVREIVNDERVALRGSLTSGLEKGLGPRTVAYDIVGTINKSTGRRDGGILGLTSRQEEWIRNYAAELADPARLTSALERGLRDKRFDPAIRSALKEGRGIDAQTIAKAVISYRNKALKLRGNTVAQNEGATAMHQSSYEAMQQAVAAGQVDADLVTGTWKTAKDSRVRDTHRSLDGKTVAWGRYFVTSSGGRLRFPHDPEGPESEVIGCRCWVMWKVDHLRQAQRDKGREEQRQAEPVISSLYPQADEYDIDSGVIEDARFLRLFDDDEGARRFADRLFAPLPRDQKLTYSITRSLGGVLVSAYSLNGRVKIDRLFTFSEIIGETPTVVVKHEVFELAKEYQGGGYAKAMLRSAIAEYQRIGVQRIDLHANLEVGGYAWARAGFVPRVAERVRREMAARLAKSALDDADKAIIGKIIGAAPDNDLMYQIANCRNSAGERIGKSLLLGSDWNGILALDDSAQLARLMHEIGM